MKVTALTVITNDTLNIKGTHEEVLEISRSRSEELSRLLKETLKDLSLF
jgi:purine nucleoside phosphorylase